MRKIKTRVWFYFRFASSLLLVSWLLHTIDFEQVWTPITPHGWVYLFLLFILLNFDRLLMSFKWQILLKAKDIVIPFADIVRSYFFSTFWGIFLPSTVGGDIIRVYRVRKLSTSSKDIISSVITERVLGTVTGLGMTFICLLLADVYFDVFDWRVVIGIFFVMIIFAGLVAFSFHGCIKSWLEESIISERPGFAGKLARIYQSYHAYGSHPIALTKFVILTAIEQCAPIIGVYLTARALGKDISFLHVAIFIPIIMMFTKIPLSLDGYGVREGLYVYLFSMVGISESDAFIVGLVSHVAQNLSMLAGFLYSTLHVSHQQRAEQAVNSLEN